MTPQPVASEPRTDTSPNKAAAPRREGFWKQRSPHHEFLFASLSSVFIHALLGAGAVLLMVSAVMSVEEAGPPQVDAVQLEGGRGGDGLGEGELPLPEGKGGPRREQGAVSPQKQPPTKAGDTKLNPLDPKRSILDVSKGTEGDPIRYDDILGDVEKLNQRIEMDLAAAHIPAGPGDTKGKGGTPGGGKIPGTGSPKEKGLGTGREKATGPGTGLSKGRAPTMREQRARRWTLEMSDDGNVHLAKLRALKVTLAIPTGRKVGEFLIYDFSNPQTTGAVGDLRVYADRVQWRNTIQRQMPGLAKALGMQRLPPYSVIFLPPGMENRMVEIEERHSGLSEDEIERTIWDVPQRDGHYANEPVILHQIPKKR